MTNYIQEPDHQIETLAVRSGQNRGPEGEHSDPIYLTSSFVFENAAQAAARFAETEPGNIYSRFTNPTVRTFEQRIAALENAEYGIATSSGMGAILTLALSVLKEGDHVVISKSVFGSTINMFKNIFSRFGIEYEFVGLKDFTAWESSIKSNTKMFFTETPSNPLLDVVDLKRLSEISRKSGVILTVDNSFLTPLFQQPLKLGADVVVHSATKYLDGQGRCIGGSLVTNDKNIYDASYKTMRTSGATMSPFNAWIFLTALETLEVRLKAHSVSALNIASWLETLPQVRKVYYPGLESHADYELSRKQQSGDAGVIAFELKGNREEAWKFIDHLKWVSITANLGDTKTTVTHPASTTHSRISEEERSDAGITESLVRLSIGLENVNDIKNDLSAGFNALSL